MEVTSAHAEDAPKERPMSHAQRRKLKQPTIIVTADMKAKQRDALRELRKNMRILKSNGARRKLGMYKKRRRGEDEDGEINVEEEDDGERLKKRRRMDDGTAEVATPAFASEPNPFPFPEAAAAPSGILGVKSKKPKLASGGYAPQKRGRNDW